MPVVRLAPRQPDESEESWQARVKRYVDAVKLNEQAVLDARAKLPDPRRRR